MALAIATISILPTLVSCRKENALWKGRIDSENGVIIVRNPVNPMLGKDACFVKEDFSIGGNESGGESALSEIIDMAVDEEGNIFVLDSKEACIRLFNETGGYLKTIGKKGQGPGEMQRPMNISITPRNEILVNDRGARILHIFGLGGEHRRSLSLARMPSFSRPRVDSQDNIVARSMTAAPGRARFVLAKFDPELNKLFDIFSYEYELSGGKIYNVFPPQCFWAVGRNDRIVWGYNDKYEIQVLDRDGRLLRTITKSYAPVKTTDDEKRDWVKFGFGDKGVPPDVKVNWPSHHNAFQSLNVDDSGKIFVETYEKAAEGPGFYHDVFDPEGRYIAKILLKATPRVVKKDKLYTIEEDEDGNQVVKRYNITWRRDSAL